MMSFWKLLMAVRWDFSCKGRGEREEGGGRERGRKGGSEGERKGEKE